MKDHIYKSRMKRLRLVHKFSFDLRQTLTSQRKSAITRVWNSAADLLKKVESGEYTFLETTKTQTDHLKTQFPHTNKGIIYNKKVDKGTKRKTTIIGKGKNIQLLDDIKIDHAVSKEYARKLTFYMKYPDWLNQLDTEQYIFDLEAELEPDFISVAINGYAGSALITAKDFAKYHVSLGNKIEQKTDATEVLTGVYIIYFVERLTTKWLEELKEKIMTFQSK